MVILAGHCHARLPRNPPASAEIAIVEYQVLKSNDERLKADKDFHSFVEHRSLFIAVIIVLNAKRFLQPFSLIAITMKLSSLLGLILCLHLGSQLQPTEAVSVRLADGSVPSEGRVEVYHGGQWGTVCDDYWDDREARVVCRQLGYVDALAAKHESAYGDGTGPIVMDNVKCTGTEKNLEDCNFPGWKVHNCASDETAGVECDATPPVINTNVTLRLVAGTNVSEGRVEVFHNGTWGTVCDDQWDFDDARVVCRQLGYDDALSAKRNAFFGSADFSARIWIDDCSCRGGESRLEDCTFAGWGSTNCDHSEDAGVVCMTGTMAPAASSVRLRGSSSSNEGNVEVLYDGQYRSVCDDNWGLDDARVVCHQLGYPGAVEAKSDNFFSTSFTSFALDDVGCSGMESRLEDCSFPGWGLSNCHAGEEAGVVCDTGPTTTPTSAVITPSRQTPPIRLADGASSHEGRIEIFHGGQWGTVCDDGWSLSDAKVACRQLGFSDADLAATRASYGPGNGTILMSQVRCQGTESALANCLFDGWEKHACSHDEDAGVVCRTPSSPPAPVRLVNGPGPSEGRLEIQYGGVWGTICDDQWDMNNTEVACRQLGFSGALSFAKKARYGRGGGTIMMDDVVCRGTESQLEACNFRGWTTSNCDHSEDIGIKCVGPSSPLPTTQQPTSRATATTDRATTDVPSSVTPTDVPSTAATSAVQTETTPSSVSGITSSVLPSTGHQLATIRPTRPTRPTGPAVSATERIPPSTKPSASTLQAEVSPSHAGNSTSTQEKTTTSTETQKVTVTDSEKKSNIVSGGMPIVPVAIGASVGAIALITAVIAIFFLRQRGGKMSKSAPCQQPSRHEPSHNVELGFSPDGACTPPTPQRLVDTPGYVTMNYKTMKNRDELNMEDPSNPIYTAVIRNNFAVATPTAEPREEVRYEESPPSLPSPLSLRAVLVQPADPDDTVAAGGLYDIPRHGSGGVSQYVLPVPLHQTTPSGAQGNEVIYETIDSIIES
eukprot:m.24021 g.24021  ORF g.24021 m.24021 type:complete len:1002 (+) comp28562_c0_seq2:1525-4530(+)